MINQIFFTQIIDRITFFFYNQEGLSPKRKITQQLHVKS
jgi:hypothetical protein